MKLKLFILGGMLYVSSTWARPLRCQEQVSFGKPVLFEIDSISKEKVSVVKSEGHRVYLSEIDSRTFELEAFVSENEIRIYSKANLKDGGDSIELSYWSRDQLLLWSCSLMQ